MGVGRYVVHVARRVRGYTRDQPTDNETPLHRLANLRVGNVLVAGVDCTLFLLQRPNQDVHVPFSAGLAALQAAMAVASRIGGQVETASAQVPGTGAAARGVPYVLTPKHLAATLAVLDQTPLFAHFLWVTESVGTKVYVCQLAATPAALRPVPYPARRTLAPRRLTDGPARTC